MPAQRHSTDEQTASPYTGKNVRAGALHYLLGKGASAIASLLSIVLLVRFTAVDTYARFTAIAGVAVLATVLGEMGLERALARFIPEGRIAQSRKDLERFIATMTWWRVAAAVVLSACVAALWPWIRTLFDNVALPAFPIAFAFYLIASSLFQQYLIVLQSLMIQKTLTRLLVIQWAGRLLMIIPFAAAPGGIPLDAVLWIMSVPEMCCVLACALVLRRHLRALPERDGRDERSGSGAGWPAWAQVRRTARDNFGYALLVTPPQNYVMAMIASATMPPYFVAAYGFFITLGDKVRQYLPVFFFYNLLEPVLVASYLKERQFGALNMRTQLLHKFNVFITLPLVVMLTVAGPEIIAFITGGKYAEYSWILLVMILQLLVTSHLALLQMILNTVNASAVLIGSASVGLAATAVSMMVAMQVIPSAFAFALAPIVFALSNTLWIVYRLRGKSFDYRIGWHALFPVLCAAAISLAATWFVKPTLGLLCQGLPMVLACAGVSVPVYLAALWALSAVSRTELAMLHGWSMARAGNRTQG